MESYTEIPVSLWSMCAGAALALAHAPVIWPLLHNGSHLHVEAVEPENVSASNQLILSIESLNRAAPWLGLPRGGTTISTGASMESHESGLLLYILPFNKIVKITPDHQFEIYNDENRESGEKMTNESALREYLGATIGQNCRPPRGGNALLWKQFPGFRSIGCSVWGCSVEAGSIRYQAFQNGLVVTGFPQFKDSRVGVNYFFRMPSGQASSGTWESSGSNTTAPMPNCYS